MLSLCIIHVFPFKHRSSNTNLNSFFIVPKQCRRPSVRKLPMDVATRIFSSSVSDLLGPIPTAPTKWEVRVGTLPNGCPSNHSNVYVEFCLFDYVSHTTVLTEKNGFHTSGDVVYRLDDLFYKSTPKGDMELTAQDIFSYWLD